MAEILGRYWQILDRSGKKIILLSPLYVGAEFFDLDCQENGSHPCRRQYATDCDQCAWVSNCTDAGFFISSIKIRGLNTSM